ncbi:MAG: cysteine--tRNA ligase [Puniceicoccales bacterium]|jgi:cysteinyl-tRNA synthetase|nr:cysteine--tRNA ligase [Puniceicoccales bacterium]
MNNLTLYNTLTKRLERVVSSGKHFGIYFCGPTVYNYAHIGNFRTYLIEDVLVRVLKLTGCRPFVVRNITDVDDKTIRDSQKFGEVLSDFTKKYTDIFHGDCDRLNILRPDVEPRATEHISEQIAMIEALIEGGHAYESEGSVYFRVSSFEKYGRLSNVGERELQTQASDSAGKRNVADEYDREDVSDFVLWKARKPEDGENFWKSPWGDGRPGWHIECSAMAIKYLGETVDLHAGGIDLCFPHHENEIAQSEACTGKEFVRHWMHIAHLTVDGAKMSKSLGNMYTLHQIEEAGFSPNALRYCLISGHYRQPLNFTMNGLHAADNALKKLAKQGEILAEFFEDGESACPENWSFLGEVYHALLNDLNVPLCLGNLFKWLGDVNVNKLNVDQKIALAREFFTIKYALGLRLERENVSVPTDVQKLANRRWQAKLQKNYTLADELRQQVEAAGWFVNDTTNGFSIVKK